MKIIYNSCTDPYFNLAAEEYLLNSTDEDIFMLWRNDRSVIIGKNQNAWAEVNTELAEKKSIKIARRITGGGAVFHDLGNINFSFITGADSTTGHGNKSSGGFDGQGVEAPTALNFADFAAPIIKALSDFGVSAAPGGRNDIIAEGAKISGCAACVTRRGDGREMQLRHGTLLFGADISEMAGILNVNRLKMKSKGIKSVKSRVMNIKDIPSYRGPADTEKFLLELIRFAEKEYGGTAGDLTGYSEEIARLKSEKFASWDWIWGKTPSFSEIREGRFPFGTVSVMMDCRGGRIEKIKIYGDFFSEEDTSSLENALEGAPLEEKELINAISRAPFVIDKYIKGCTDRLFAGVILNGGEQASGFMPHNFMPHNKG